MRLILPLQNNLTLLKSLHHMCLLTGVFASDDYVNKILCDMDIVMPNLKIAHVHYRRPPDGAEQRVTWMRNAPWSRGPRVLGPLLRDCPCVLCSTATYIGLARPQTTQRDDSP
ncbi:hypothetical protein MTO96_044875 [Rhipicephalus appendiculatus]